MAGGGVLALAPWLYLVPALRLLRLCCSMHPLGCVLQIATATALWEWHNRSRTDAGPLLPMVFKCHERSCRGAAKGVTMRQPVCLPSLYGFGLFFGVRYSLMTELPKG